MRALVHLFAGLLVAQSAIAAATDKPNIIIVLADDLGLGDLSVNGSVIQTPNIDALAAEGIQFDQFLASANVCTPSRAGLLTGRYAIRMGLAHKALPANSDKGIPDAELTLAEALKPAGYRSALVGKWHLGAKQQHWPTRHGFDEFYGVLYSNDMKPFALFDGDQKIEEPATQTTLTQRYTARTQSFIRDNADRPFFVLLSHSFPHYPPFASEAFSGRSVGGPYGDSVEELDASLGAIDATLVELGLKDNTIVMFTSDNGAWFEGSNHSLRGGKGETWAGGYRVPFILRWPSRIGAGQRSGALTMNTDVVPSILDVVAEARKPDAPLDGKSLWPILQGEREQIHPSLVLFNNEDVAGIRTPRWKYLVRGYYRDNYAAFDDFEKGFGFDYPLLYDMSNASGEHYSVARNKQQVVIRMQELLADARQEFEPLRTRAAAPTVP